MEHRILHNGRWKLLLFNPGIPRYGGSVLMLDDVLMWFLLRNFAQRKHTGLYRFSFSREET
jgi:hypothetical protein